MAPECEGKAVQKGFDLPIEEAEWIRFSQIGRKKDFVHIERINGKPINILNGLELHTEVFNSDEQTKIVDYIYKLQRMGQKGQLKERTYSEPRKWMRGKGRVTIQFGCCYNYAVDKNGNPPGIIRNEEVDPIPPMFKTIIRRLVRWHVLPPTVVPNSCIVNIYEEGDCIPPHIDHHDFVRPFCTVSFLTESKILFGSSLRIVGPGEFAGPVAIPLPVGSVLILSGNGADVAKHCVPGVSGRRISITFRKMDDSKLPYKFLPDPDLQGLQPFSPNKSPSSQVRTPLIRRNNPELHNVVEDVGDFSKLVVGAMTPESEGKGVQKGFDFSREEREHIRFSQIGREKDFVHIERINRKPINILKGLELQTKVFNSDEQKKIVDYVYKQIGRKRIRFEVQKGFDLFIEETERRRFSQIGRKKDFVHIERINGKTINILKGLELHTEVFNSDEQEKIVDYVYKLQRMGQKGQLKERTYSEPRKWMRGKGRVTIQFGCCYNYAVDKNGNPPGIIRDEEVDPIPSMFKAIIKRLVRWHVLPPTVVPNSCIVNIYEEGDCIPPHIDHHDFVRPFCTLSFLTKSKILFGSNLRIVGPGEFAGPVAIPLPAGSVLILSGNGADVAKHCVPGVSGRRISITFRKMDDSKLPYRFLPDPDLQGLQPFVPNESPSSQVRTPDIRRNNPKLHNVVESAGSNSANRPSKRKLDHVSTKPITFGAFY